MKIIKKSQDARNALKKGIDLVADCVKVTLGPAGRNAVLGRQNITPIITNDGVTIAHNIEAEDEFEQAGVMMVKEATILADNNAGDGTTTTTVLLQAIVNKLFEKIEDDGSLIKNKVNVIQLKKDLDIWCSKVCDKLKENSRQITQEDIYNVAIVSGEFDWIAKMVADIYTQIGKDGYVTVEEGVKTSYEIFKGIELGVGFQSEYFINNDNQECVLENPRILVTNKNLDLESIIPLVELMGKNELKEVIVIAPDFTKDLISRLNTTKVKTGFSVVCVKQPIFGKNDLLLDVATLSESKFFDDMTDIKKDLSLISLGKIERATISASRTVLVGGKGDTTKRVQELRDIFEKTESVYDKNTLEKRIAYLSGGIALIKIGAESEFEKTYLKLKLEDALNAVQYALQEGVVKGGGLALKDIATLFKGDMFSSALEVPYNQIQENAGGNLDIPDTIIDPLKTVVTALKSACSLAGMLITTEVAVVYKNIKEKNND